MRELLVAGVKRQFPLVDAVVSGQEEKTEEGGEETSRRHRQENSSRQGYAEIMFCMIPNSVFIAGAINPPNLR